MLNSPVHSSLCCALCLALYTATGQAAESLPHPYTGGGEPKQDRWILELGQGRLRFSPHLQYFVRAEADGGKDFRPGGSRDFVNQRARVGASGLILDRLAMMVQIQDVRRWGEEGDPATDFSADGLDLHQAWAELQAPLFGLTLRVGRQELAYDGQRILGRSPWTMWARSFDAARIAFERGLLQVHALWAKVRERDSSDQTTSRARDQDLLGLWTRYRVASSVEASLLWLWDRDSAVKRNRFTFGLFLRGELSSELRYQAEGYAQLGRYGTDAERQSHRAFLAALSLSYALAKIPWRPLLTAFGEILSGDDNPSDEVDHTFDTLFATNHRHYGWMDFFLNIPLDTQGFGLVDLGGGVQATPLDNLRFNVNVHHFRLAKAYNLEQRDLATLGTELDSRLTLHFPPYPYLIFQAGFSAFFPRSAAACVARGMPNCRDQPDRRGTMVDPEYFGYVLMNLLL